MVGQDSWDDEIELSQMPGSVDVAEWLRRTPAKCMGSPARVRISSSTILAQNCITSRTLFA